jgi:hypothetical protein
MDGRCGLTLTFDGLPQLMITAIPQPDDTLRLVQIQGLQAARTNESRREVIKGPDGKPLERIGSKGLFGLDTPILATRLMLKVAAMGGYKKLEIVSGENNLWIRPNDIKAKPELKLERAQQIYDRSATELGFEKNAAGNFEKAVERA